jgi:hypothetical protein
MALRATMMVLGGVMVGTDPDVAAAIARLEAMLEAQTDAQDARMDRQDARLEKIELGVNKLTTFLNEVTGGNKLLFHFSAVVAGVCALVFGAMSAFHK